jgi:Ca2+-binding RTX toxin-like protein
MQGQRKRLRRVASAPGRRSRTLRDNQSAGDGDDLIRASVGDDTLFGDAGNDALHAGIGAQTLDGGEGDDTIWAGTGAQTLLGDNGADIIHGGAGAQTLVGGAGGDALWAGSDNQVLEGGDGNDVLQAGSGNQTLSGGAGRDTFVFPAASGHDIIADFRAGQDSIQLAAGFGGATLARVQDLASHISADARGDAVLSFGHSFSLMLQHIAAQQARTHIADFFRIS